MHVYMHNISLFRKGEQKLYTCSPYFLWGRQEVPTDRGGHETINLFDFVTIFQIKVTLYKNAEEKDILHLCNLLIILQCLI